jgi:hypothetical protein
MSAVNAAAEAAGISASDVARNIGKAATQSENGSGREQSNAAQERDVTGVSGEINPREAE